MQLMDRTLNGVQPKIMGFDRQVCRRLKGLYFPAIYRYCTASRRCRWKLASHHSRGKRRKICRVIPYHRAWSPEIETLLESGSYASGAGGALIDLTSRKTIALKESQVQRCTSSSISRQAQS